MGAWELDLLANASSGIGLGLIHVGWASQAPNWRAEIAGGQCRQGPRWSNGRLFFVPDTTSMVNTMLPCNGQATVGETTVKDTLDLSLIHI